MFYNIAFESPPPPKKRIRNCHFNLNKMSTIKAGLRRFKHLRGLSVKYEDTVNTEANTSNNMELFLFVLLRTIWQIIYEFSHQYVISEIKY